MQSLPQVARVMHPALPDDPSYDLWKKDYKGAGGLFGLALKSEDYAKASKFVEALQYFGLGYSWGGHESLAVLPNFGDRTVAKPEDKGVIVRLQIGLEDVEDLQKDIEKAFAAAGL